MIFTQVCPKCRTCWCVQRKTIKGEYVCPSCKTGFVEQEPAPMSEAEAADLMKDLRHKFEREP